MEKTHFFNTIYRSIKNNKDNMKKENEVIKQKSTSMSLSQSNIDFLEMVYQKHGIKKSTILNRILDKYKNEYLKEMLKQ